MPYLIEMKSKRSNIRQGRAVPSKWLFYMKVSSVKGDEAAQQDAEKYAKDLENSRARNGNPCETRITYVKAIQLPDSALNR